METLTNMASVATKALLGDGNAHKEPVSGVQGNVARGEPFDAGNLGTPDQSEVERELTKEETEAIASKPSATAPVPGDTIGGPAPKENVMEGDKGTSNDVPRADPANSDNPVEPSGPGPKPLDALAKEHQGDAGRNGHTEDPVQFKDGPPANDEPESDSKGTGQEHVKSTGFAAEGGDFDATKPGAGKEADRLVEQNGGSPTNGSGRRSESTGASEKGSSKHSKRHSLSEKIKAKLHKH